MIIIHDVFDFFFSKAINLAYEEFVLNVGDFDERIFLGKDAALEMGTPMKNAPVSNAADLSERMQATRNLRPHFDLVDIQLYLLYICFSHVIIKIDYVKGLINLLSINHDKQNVLHTDCSTPIIKSPPTMWWRLIILVLSIVVTINFIIIQQFEVSPLHSSILI